MKRNRSSQVDDHSSSQCHPTTGLNESSDSNNLITSISLPPGISTINGGGSLDSLSESNNHSPGPDLKRLKEDLLKNSVTVFQQIDLTPGPTPIHGQQSHGGDSSVKSANSLDEQLSDGEKVTGGNTKFNVTLSNGSNGNVQSTKSNNQYKSRLSDPPPPQPKESILLRIPESISVHHSISNNMTESQQQNRLSGQQSHNSGQSLSAGNSSLGAFSSNTNRDTKLGAQESSTTQTNLLLNTNQKFNVKAQPSQSQSQVNDSKDGSISVTDTPIATSLKDNIVIDTPTALESASGCGSFVTFGKEFRQDKTDNPQQASETPLQQSKEQVEVQQQAQHSGFLSSIGFSSGFGIHSGSKGFGSLKSNQSTNSFQGFGTGNLLFGKMSETISGTSTVTQEKKPASNLFGNMMNGPSSTGSSFLMNAGPAPNLFQNNNTTGQSQSLFKFNNTITNQKINMNDTENSSNQKKTTTNTSDMNSDMSNGSTNSNLTTPISSRLNPAPSPAVSLVSQQSQNQQSPKSQIQQQNSNVINLTSHNECARLVKRVLNQSITGQSSISSLPFGPNFGGAGIGHGVSRLPTKLKPQPPLQQEYDLFQGACKFFELVTEKTLEGQDQMRWLLRSDGAIARLRLRLNHVNVNQQNNNVNNNETITVNTTLVNPGLVTVVDQIQSLPKAPQPSPGTNTVNTSSSSSSSPDSISPPGSPKKNVSAVSSSGASSPSDGGPALVESENQTEIQNQSQQLPPISLYVQVLVKGTYKVLIHTPLISNSTGLNNSVLPVGENSLTFLGKGTTTAATNQNTNSNSKVTSFRLNLLSGENRGIFLKYVKIVGSELKNWQTIMESTVTSEQDNLSTQNKKVADSSVPDSSTGSAGNISLGKTG